MARVGDGVYVSNGKVSGIPTKVVGDKAQGPAPKGHPSTGKSVPTNPQAAAKAGMDMAKQNDGNAG